MYIKPGQTTAIVGPTGAGKTTIVKLLMRFYELNAGSIYIDGHNITEYTRSGLRNMVGMILRITKPLQIAHCITSYRNHYVSSIHHDFRLLQCHHDPSQ